MEAVDGGEELCSASAYRGKSSLWVSSFEYCVVGDGAIMFSEGACHSEHASR